MDEITNHFLKVFVSHNIRHKGVLDNKEMEAQKPTRAAPANAGQNQRDVVLNLMKEVTRTSRFAHKNDLWTMCQRQMSNEEFVAALQTLQDNGAIYTTIGDDCFAVTD
mgnify:CR=1 FL=1